MPSHEDAPATSDGAPCGNRICSQHPNHLAVLDHRGLRRLTVARVALVEYCITVLVPFAVWLRTARRSGPTGPCAIRMEECLHCDYCRWLPSRFCLTHLCCVCGRELTSRMVILCGVVFENVGGGGGRTAGHLGLSLGDGTTKGVVAQRTPKCARGICSCMAAFA